MVARVLLSAVLVVLVACSQDVAVSQDAGTDTDDPATSGASPTAGADTHHPATAGASPTAGADALQPSEGFEVSEVVFTDGEQRIPMPVLVADDRSLRTTGLMHRTELPEDAGMLFVFDAPTSGAFWMKNTLLPLSIAFVGADGTVQQVLDMEPCTADPCPRYAPDGTYLRTVEANQGYFAAHGITAGWSMEVEAPRGGGR
jgi:uncharacterized membrane protein (UPF0127 family)